MSYRIFAGVLSTLVVVTMLVPQALFAQGFVQVDKRGSEKTLQRSQVVNERSKKSTIGKVPFQPFQSVLSSGDLKKKQQPVEKSDYVQGEVLVKFKKDQLDVESSSMRNFARGKGLRIQTKFEGLNSVVLQSDSNMSVEDLVQELKNDPNVEYAEPNYVYQPREVVLQNIPNDTNFGDLWALNNPEDHDIDAPEAWGISTGSQDVIVGILDTGIAYNHPDLADNMWDGSAGCIDQFGVEMVCPNHGWNFVDNNSNTFDGLGHGTHIAGTIGAKGNNGEGVTGVNWNVKLMALRVGNNEGYITGDILSAIDFAIYNHVKVLNASWGGGYRSQALHDAIERFGLAGGIFVTAAGNYAQNNDEVPDYPCNYDLDNIICVAATDQNDELADFSHFGPINVDVAAPGVGIYSTVPSYNQETVFFGAPTPNNFPNIPQGWSNDRTWYTGNFNTRLHAQPQALGGGAQQELNHAFIGDLVEPYANNNASSLTLPAVDLTNTELGASINFLTACDTDYYDGTWNEPWHDYLRLEFSEDGGQTFQRMAQWDEEIIDNDSNPDNLAFANIGGSIPPNFLTSNFTARFTWVSDNDADNGTFGAGCAVDAIHITKISHGDQVVYDYMSGTSMATPHVAGLAALVWSNFPDLTTAQVKQRILENGDALPSLQGKVKSGNRINAYKALSITPVAPPVREVIATVCGVNYYEGDEYPARPVVCDGDMELNDYVPGRVGTTNWVQWGNPNTLSKQTYFGLSGTHSLYVNSLERGAGVQQTNIGVEAGKSYRFSFHYRLESGEIRPRLGVNDSNSDFEGRYDKITSDIHSGDWSEYSREFTVPENFSGDFRVVISGVDAEFYIDDVQVTELDPQIVSPALLIDGNMEAAGTANWLRWGNPTNMEKVAYEGYGGVQSLYLEASAQGSGFQQLNLPLQPGKTYRLSFFYRVLSGQVRQLIGINSSNADFEGKRRDINPENAQWNQYTREFTMPEEINGPVNLVFTIRDGEGYFDDITLEEINQLNRVADADMEQLGVGNWQRYGVPLSLGKEEHTTQQGDQALRVDSTGVGAGVQQLNIPVTPGKTYTLSMAYTFVGNGNGSRIRPMLNLRDINKNGDFEGIYKNLPQTASDTFELYKRTFIVPENTTSDLRLMITLRDGVAQIDDVRLFEHVAADPALQVTPNSGNNETQTLVLGSVGTQIGAYGVQVLGDQEFCTNDIRVKVATKNGEPITLGDDFISASTLANLPSITNMSLWLQTPQNYNEIGPVHATVSADGEVFSDPICFTPGETYNLFVESDLEYNFGSQVPADRIATSLTLENYTNQTSGDILHGEEVLGFESQIAEVGSVEIQSADTPDAENVLLHEESDATVFHFKLHEKSGAEDELVRRVDLLTSAEVDPISTYKLIDLDAPDQILSTSLSLNGRIIFENLNLLVPKGSSKNLAVSVSTVPAAAMQNVGTPFRLRADLVQYTGVSTATQGLSDGYAVYSPYISVHEIEPSISMFYRGALGSQVTENEMGSLKVTNLGNRPMKVEKLQIQISGVYDVEGGYGPKLFALDRADNANGDRIYNTLTPEGTLPAANLVGQEVPALGTIIEFDLSALNEEIAAGSSKSFVVIADTTNMKDNTQQGTTAVSKLDILGTSGVEDPNTNGFFWSYTRTTDGSSSGLLSISESYPVHASPLRYE